MTISVWRYSHLALAISSFAFIALAAVTGIVLSFQPVAEKIPSYRAENFSHITLAETIPVLKKSFTEITEVSVDVNQFVTVKGIDTTGKNVTAYADPATGKILGTPPKKNEFFLWVMALHRSLFLHETGRFFVGLTAFLLLLIALSGTILVIQRQRGVKRFFKKIVKENFAQYYHVVLGRLSLIVILIISLSGVYLSLARFTFFTEKKITHNIDFDKIKAEPSLPLKDFAIFKNTPLSKVQTIEYPFSDDPEDYYMLKLDDRELVINQFTGETLSEINYSKTTWWSNLSLDLHTGRRSIIWAIVLGLASINILFFIYSGFVITFRRTRSRIKNKYRFNESRFVILVGSENGSTMRFAKAVQQQLISNGQTVFLAELNQYKVFPKAEHLVILTATYGLGDAPSNANKFLALLEKYPQTQPVQFSIVGFGSHAYPDFCRAAFDFTNALSKKPWATPVLEVHTINDKSPKEFRQWFESWSQKLALPPMALPTTFYQKPADLQAMSVVERTSVAHEDGAFIIRLKPPRTSKFNSGDLLAVYPTDDYRERQYSVGKINNEIQLSVKLHRDGLGSGYLYRLAVGDVIRAQVIANANFQFPQKAPVVIMISNGTGIAPFLGMIDQNNKKIECHLYCGFREAASFTLYQEVLKRSMALKKLSEMHVAYSREGDKQYVKDLLARDENFVADTLRKGGVLMLCGSLAMQNDVIELLEIICNAKTGKPVSFYQSHGQVLMDCY